MLCKIIKITQCTISMQCFIVVLSVGEKNKINYFHLSSVFMFLYQSLMCQLMSTFMFKELHTLRGMYYLYYKEYLKVNINIGQPA